MARNQEKMGKHNKLRWFVIGLAVLLVLMLGVAVIYLSDYSQAGENAIATLEKQELKVSRYDFGITMGNPEADQGFIFYPGGKVEYTAYAPLLEELVKEGVFCVIAKMPFHLAVFNSNAAKEIIEQFPDTKEWYLGGHSLGGAMAAAYAGKHAEQLKGLILLAAYSTTDLTKSGLKVLTLYGSEDTVLNKSKLEEGRKLLPYDQQELRIKGGNHAQFGDYGLQKGDGKALIDAEVQRSIAVENMLELIKKN